MSCQFYQNDFGKVWFGKLYSLCYPGDHYKSIDTSFIKTGAVV